jgi:glycine cleavage system aminomethyltransferase T
MMQTSAPRPSPSTRGRRSSSSARASWGAAPRTTSAGLGFAVKPDKGDFIGRDALLRRRERPARRRLSCLSVDDGTVLMGSEPVFAAAEPRRGAVGFTTSAGYGHSVGASLAYAWWPSDLTDEGTTLQVSYFDQRHPATVVSDPVLDPNMERMRC